MHSFLSGSYSRNTQIRPINDVDIVILFDIEEYWDQFKNNPRGMLNFTGENLKETYPDKDIIIQSHSIGIKFKDLPDVDVIPGFIKDYNNEIYLIPNFNLNNFIETSPTKHKAIISRHNQNLGEKFIHIIKMMKCWRNNLVKESVSKYGIELKFKSFHLEIILMNILKNRFSNYAKAIQQVFSKAAENLNQECHDPAGLSGRLDGYLTESQIRILKNVFNNTSENIKSLLRLEMEGKYQEAIEGWRELFGDQFPRPLKTNKKTYKKNLATKFPIEGKNYTYGEE